MADLRTVPSETKSGWPARLVISIWQYRWTVRYVWSRSLAPIAGMTKEGPRSPVIAVAVLLIFISVFTFFAVLLRLA
jgi:hypothetical protein